ncbi:hypothetical protein FRACYDRAFT_154861, partial [Fragilariopsis cylindrus CCMP1102]
LGNWVNNQRKQHAKEKLNGEYVARLDSIGMIWKIHSPWWDMYEKLILYQKENGDTKVPQMYKVDGLGKWVNNQRTRPPKDNYNRNKLNELGFEWTI